VFLIHTDGVQALLGVGRHKPFKETINRQQSRSSSIRISPGWRMFTPALVVTACLRMNAKDRGACAQFGFIL
jgi:hypothetical protein